jgi:hypothetical protein
MTLFSLKISDVRPEKDLETSGHGVNKGTIWVFVNSECKENCDKPATFNYVRLESKSRDIHYISLEGTSNSKGTYRKYNLCLCASVGQL